MSALLQATLNRKSPGFRNELAALKAKTCALAKQHPDKRLITGKREDGDQVHVVVMLGKPGRTSNTTEIGNYVVAF